MVKHKIYSGMWICVGNYFVEKMTGSCYRFYWLVVFLSWLGVTGLTCVLDWIIFDTDFALRIIWEGN